MKKHTPAHDSSSVAGSETLHAESERCRGDIRSPLSQPEKEAECDGEAETLREVGGTKTGPAGGTFSPLGCGGSPTICGPISQLSFLEETVPGFSDDGVEDRR